MSVIGQLPAPVVEVGGTFAVAVVYALAAYSSKWLKDGDTFQPRKFLRTVIVGLIVGVVAAQTGQSLSIGTVPELASAVGAVHVAELVVNAVLGGARRRGGGTADQGGA